MLAQPVGEGGVPLFGVSGQGAVGTGRVAEAEELTEGALRPFVAAQPGAEGHRPALITLSRRPRDGVHHAVDDDGADPVREQVGVGLAEERSVGEAEIVQRPVTHRLP